MQIVFGRRNFKIRTFVVGIPQEPADEAQGRAGWGGSGPGLIFSNYTIL